MEPYRTAGFLCPTCPEGTSLREFQNRLACDECHGLFMDGPDLASACSDMDGQQKTLAFEGDKPTTKSCPRCERTLVESVVAIQPTRVKAKVMRCERHGLWCPANMLASVFARMSGRRGPGGGMNTMTAAGLTHTGLDGLPIPTGGSASAGLRISQWRSRSRKRAQTLTPINAYRDQRLLCPTCADKDLVFVGDRYVCGQCGGTFVQNAALEGMILDIAHEQFEMPLVTGAPGPRACPVCTKPLIVEDLERVPIDRCEQHGVWFDPPELTIALERASGEFEPRGVRAWLKKLFT